MQFAISKTHMTDAGSTGWNLYEPRTGPIYQSEPKLGSGPGPVYESESKIGSRPDFFWAGAFGESENRIPICSLN